MNKQLSANAATMMMMTMTLTSGSALMF